jgi:hypothetical protein
LLNRTANVPAPQMNPPRNPQEPAKANPQVPGQAYPQVPPKANPQVPPKANPQVPPKANPQVPSKANPQVPPKSKSRAKRVQGKGKAETQAKGKGKGKSVLLDDDNRFIGDALDLDEEAPADEPADVAHISPAYYTKSVMMKLCQVLRKSDGHDITVFPVPLLLMTCAEMKFGQRPIHIAQAKKIKVLIIQNPRSTVNTMGCWVANLEVSPSLANISSDKMVVFGGNHYKTGWDMAVDENPDIKEQVRVQNSSVYAWGDLIKVFDCLILHRHQDPKLFPYLTTTDEPKMLKKGIAVHADYLTR